MKSLVVTDSISRAAGGLFDAERRLHQELAKAGVEVAVFGLEDEFSAADSAAWKPIVPRTFAVRPPAALGWSPNQQRAVMEQPADILYRAGLWRLPSRTAHQWSRHYRKPEIIAPHGMLDPWAVKNSRWKKQIVRWLFEDAHLRDAACIRALCQSEADAIRAFGLTNPIAIIPNAIDIPEIGNRKSEIGNAPWAGAIEPGRKVLLYLGRLHPKKGLVNLLKAWAAVRKSEIANAGFPSLEGSGVGSQNRKSEIVNAGFPSPEGSGVGSQNRKSEIVNRKSDDWTLVLAGWDQGGHEAELKQLATELGLPWGDGRAQKPGVSISAFQHFSVFFVGPQFGDAKAACYANCDAFILPSFSEGLPMVVLEAWAYGKPVLMTPECNLPEGFAANAAIRIEANPESLARGLTELLRVPNSALRVLSDNGRSLVTSRFTWPTVAEQMLSVYRWLVQGGPPPECVRLR